MQLRLDPWPAEYESAIPFEDLSLEPAPPVDHTVETADWRAIPPQAPPAAAELCFVDGVRRVEARVLAQPDLHRPLAPGPRPLTLVHGLFGTLAVGAVRSRAGEAVFSDLAVRRFLILGAGLESDSTLRIGGAPIRFEALSTAANTPAEILATLQNQMRTWEALLGESLTGPDRRVFVDGPLTYFSGARQEVVGIIKTIHQPYLAAAQFGLVGSLAAGWRTPLFAIVGQGSALSGTGRRPVPQQKYDRYSWYLRVADGRAIDHKLAGILRLEVRAAVGLERALALADCSAAELPRFASTSARDARAPQNLLPVGALEEELRRRLGDPLLLRRAVEIGLHEAATA